ncbi:hypothetical protein J6590_078545 [Homalodisca vitripennis]|nr:hypothetical protein J6590_078545 [Homalodisca vitripennis]
MSNSNLFFEVRGEPMLARERQKTSPATSPCPSDDWNNLLVAKLYVVVLVTAIVSWKYEGEAMQAHDWNNLLVAKLYVVVLVTAIVSWKCEGHRIYLSQLPTLPLRRLEQSLGGQTVRGCPSHSNSLLEVRGVKRCRRVRHRIYLPQLPILPLRRLEQSLGGQSVRSCPNNSNRFLEVRGGSDASARGTENISRNFLPLPLICLEQYFETKLYVVVLVTDVTKHIRDVVFRYYFRSATCDVRML